MRLLICSFFAVFLIANALKAQDNTPEFVVRSGATPVAEFKKSKSSLLLKTPILSVFKSEETEYLVSSQETFIHTELSLLVGESVFQFRKTSSGKVTSFTEVVGLKLGQDQVYRADWTIDLWRRGVQIRGTGQTYFVVHTDHPVVVFSTLTSYWDYPSGLEGSISLSSRNQSLVGFLQRYNFDETTGNYFKSHVGIVEVTLTGEGIPNEEFSDLGFQASRVSGKNELRYRVATGLNDSRVNLRVGSSLGSRVIRILSGNENLQLLDVSYPEEMVNGKKGHWVKVETEEDEIGWLWSDYIQTDFAVGFSTERNGYIPRDLLKRFIVSVKSKNLVAINKCLDEGFDFGADAGFNGYVGAIYDFGFLSEDEPFMRAYIKLLFDHIGNTNSRLGEEFMYHVGNPLKFSIHIRNKAAINAILDFRPDFLTRELHRGTGCDGPLPPIIITAIEANDIETTDYLFQKGFKPDWVYITSGCSSAAPGGLYGNLVSWSVSTEMTDFLVAKGAKIYLQFSEPWKERLSVAATLYFDISRETSIPRSKESEIAVLGVYAKTDVDHRGTDKIYVRYLKVIYKGEPFVVKSTDIDFGNLWDE